MKMGKKVREYKAGDFIFAKVKGYPAWPARVQRPNGKKYFVYFYGTGETANLPPNMIFDYAENKDKFLSKAVKRRDFNDGVKQIEHDFANNVPLEQVIGVAMEVPEESANDTANDSAINDTIDESPADTTAADETAIDESTINTTQNEQTVEDSDENGALVIDEGKKGRKSSVKPPPVTPKPMKEPKTPRGKKKEDSEESKEQEKKDEEIVSRSGRKIRPKRYIDEQTEENTTLPSPAPKKRRGASPTPDKEERIDKPESKNKTEKSGKQLNTVTQAELEDLKEPFSSAGNDKENILIAYLPQGQYVGIKLFQSRPTSFKNEPARLQWDKQQSQNAITLKQQLEKGQITSQSVITQLVMDLNLTDEEKATLDKERETEEKKSRVQFLKTEMKLIELEAKIKTCLCLEKADTDLCLKLLDEFSELDIKPLMLLKHPSCGETVKRLRAYVGNAPSWELSESAALLFAKQAHRIRRRADSLYRRVKELFTVPEGLSFWEFFSERVEHFKKVTAKLSPDELLELVHEPLEMSVPTSHTMKASVEAANEEEPMEDDSSPKKKTTAKQKKPSTNSTPSKPVVKRQSSRRQQEDKEEKDKETSEQEKSEKAVVENAETESKSTDKTEVEKDNMEVEQSTEKSVNSTEETNSEDAPGDSSKKDSTDDNDTAITNEKSTDESNKTKDEPEKTNKNKDEPEKGNKTKEDAEKMNKVRDESEKADKSQEESEKVNKNETDKASKGTGESERGTKSNSSKEQSKQKSPSPSDKEKNSKSPKDVKGNDSAKSKEEKAGKEENTERTEEKHREDEPRAKRSRENKKTEIPPRPPAKRKAKF